MPLYFKNSFHDLAKACDKAGLGRERVCIVCDTNTAPLYAKDVSDALAKRFRQIDVYAFPAGEENKTLASIEALYGFLISRHYDRHDTLLALGGGVVGDMTGFAAATYLRGIRYAQIPTTLLAQVDSSIGGKTGVDYEGYKNMVGAFHMPAFVFTNVRTLATLPADQFSSGMGEVLKTALIADEKFYEWTIGHMEEIGDRNFETILKMVKSTAAIKEAIVERDPTEKGERALLNLGHTIGHAIEKYKNFSMFHGQCVALGCIAAASISRGRELISPEELYEIRDMCVAFDLPMFVDGIDEQAVLEITKADKKMKGGQVRFILLKGIGEAFIADDVTDEEILNGIRFINGDGIVYEE